MHQEAIDSAEFDVIPYCIDNHQHKHSLDKLHVQSREEPPQADINSNRRLFKSTGIENVSKHSEKLLGIRAEYMENGTVKCVVLNVVGLEREAADQHRKGLAQRDGSGVATDETGNGASGIVFASLKDHWQLARRQTASGGS
ncbi:hypothetical protein DEU56DRAFT_750863 [Suillus clintonianus]|uniref:uncharacterized protein n=1 Tax=Suillus clintonianus TaxID=1904413 RepID=UPI001B885FE9|nr:uncharacterized protein DEU56DRAFT_750863 [Suillus clintonianus]KAG2156322.1 hypothetical protein DEU56DRAFT_750863 [Suillus clintonianus]